MDALFIEEAPPLDSAWLEYAKEACVDTPTPQVPILVRQPAYAAERRVATATMTAPGARDHRLIQGVEKQDIAVQSSVDSFPIPVRQYDNRSSSGESDPVESILLYIHGGGLLIGESDSEELSCLRILKDSGIPNLRVYSVGYRLMPTYQASFCVSDCTDVFNHLLAVAETCGAKKSILVLGSSSGGQLAAMVSQTAPPGTVRGVVLRGPVTTDPFSGEAKEYVPENFRQYHHSTDHPSFKNALGTGLNHEIPRDGLPRLPLDVPEDELSALKLPRHFIQVCTNDVFYSDGVCYAKLLSNTGVDVKVDVVVGWPHTFWLKAPELPRALEADQSTLRGLAWVAGVGEI